MNTMTADPVLFDDCEYSDAQELLHDGKPYTGVVVERGPAGQVISEQHFRAGILDGTVRMYSLDGAMNEEVVYAFGRRQRWREWHANGRLKRDIHYDERGHTRSDQAWDDHGAPLDPRSLA